MEDPIQPERYREHEAKLKAIREKKAATTDQERIKQLDNEIEDEQEKYLSRQEKVCKRICAAFSE